MKRGKLISVFTHPSSLRPHPLFREPTVGIQKLDADALLAIARVRPDAIDFGINGSTIGWREAYSGSEFNNRIGGKRCAAATDLDGDCLRLKQFAVSVVPLQHYGKVNRDARVAR